MLTGLRVLVVGGGHAEVPMVRTLKSLGHFVVTVGNNKDGLAHQLADESAFLDFSDVQAVESYFVNQKLDTVIPGCNDFAMITAASIAEKYNVGNYDTLQTTRELHLKDKFRKICADLKLNAPRACSFDDLKTALDYTRAELMSGKSLIVKPVDLTGGKGVCKICNIQETDALVGAAFERSRIKRVVVEDFVEGSNHGLSCFLSGGRIVWYFWDNEYYYLDDYSVAGTLFPGSSTPETLHQLCTQIEKLAVAKNLVDGLLHVQYIDHEGVPYLIEVMRRPPGDLYLNFVEAASLRNYTALILKGFLGEGISNFEKYAQNRIIARHCIKGFQEGLVTGIKYSEQLSNHIVREFRLFEKDVYLVNFLTQKLSILLLEFSDMHSAHLLSEELYKHVQVSYAAN